MGFKLGASLSTFLFLWLAARESWKVTVSLAIGTYLFFVIAGDLLRLTELDPGMVAGLARAERAQFVFSRSIARSAVITLSLARSRGRAAILAVLRASPHTPFGL